MKLFKFNQEKKPDGKFMHLIGFARGGMAINEYKSPAKKCRIAAKNAPQE